MTSGPYRRLSPLTPLVRGGIVVVAAAATTWDDLLRGDLGPIALLFVGLLVAGAVYGFASWYRTKFWVGTDELRVDTGVINQQSRRIRIDRLQGIDIVQPFLARLFGLAELRLDVAGGDREGSLAFLPLSDARELKDQLLARRDAARAGRSVDEGAGPGPAAAAATPPPPERILARVAPGQLVASILLSGEAVSLVLVAVGLAVGSLVAGSIGGFSVALPILGGMALVLFRRFVANYGFTVSEGAAGMQARRGLFDLNAQTIALPRVQGVVVTEPALWRLFGWARLDVSIAGYASSSEGREGAAASTVLPVGDRAVVLQLARHVLDGVDPDRTPVWPPPDRARWVAPVGRRFLRAGADDRVAVSRDGWVTRRTHVVPHARIQSLRLVQGPWQRRLGLADLELDSPPGPVSVRMRHRELGQAREWLAAEIAVSRAARQDRDRAAGA